MWNTMWAHTEEKNEIDSLILDSPSVCWQLSVQIHLLLSALSEAGQVDRAFPLTQACSEDELEVVFFL